jgi:hypothetical protein
MGLNHLLRREVGSANREADFLRSRSAASKSTSVSASTITGAELRRFACDTLSIFFAKLHHPIRIGRAVHR